MIERVARAIAQALGDPDWQRYLDPARAAVSALRDPTVAMLEAALPDVSDWGDLPEDWQAMIDHVLHESIQAVKANGGPEATREPDEKPVKSPFPVPIR